MLRTRLLFFKHICVNVLRVGRQLLLLSLRAWRVDGVLIFRLRSLSLLSLGDSPDQIAVANRSPLGGVLKGSCVFFLLVCLLAFLGMPVPTCVCATSFFFNLFGCVLTCSFFLSCLTGARKPWRRRSQRGRSSHEGPRRRAISEGGTCGL